tara:strand:+ start:1090 stop:1794 length:705 start_codon:yes stop_codon:yes gene_type:complete
MDENEEDLFPTLVEAPKQPQLDLKDDVELSDEEVEEEENIVPEIKPKGEKIDQNEMFISDKPKKNVKVKIVDNVEEDEPPPTIAPVKPVKKKRVMSEAQKLKLAEARKKALETRRINAQKRKEEKELIKQEKELSKAMRKKRVSKMKDIVEDKVLPKPQQVEVKKEVIQTGYTEDQLQMAIAKALEVEEQKRQVRKAKKKELKAEEEKKKQIFNTVNRAVSGDPELDKWSHCFV